MAWKPAPLGISSCISLLNVVATRAIKERSKALRSITLDKGSEFTGHALEAWAIPHGVQLCFIRPGMSG